MFAEYINANFLLSRNKIHSQANSNIAKLIHCL